MLWLTDITVEEGPVTSIATDCSGNMSDAEPAPAPIPATQLPPDSQPTATTSSSAVAADIKQPRKLKRKPNKTGDDSLFNSWLSSEIEKNEAKKELMKHKISKISAEKDLIELMKLKTSLEIQNLQNQFQPVLFGSEL